MTRVALRGASAEALDALVQELRGDQGSDWSRLGEDLLGVASVLRSEAGLRRVATDQSVDASAKAALVRQVFGAVLSARGLEIVVDAVTRRWTGPRDLAQGMEHLGIIAVATSASADAERLSDELFTLGETIETDPRLREALSDPARSEGDKAALLRNLLEGRGLPATIRLAELALNGTHRSVTAALGDYQKIAASIQGEAVAKVRVARPLEEAERERLRATLSRQYGRAVHLNVTVEPGLFGGIRVEIGDDVIDGTVASRLDDARRRLAG